MSRKDKRNKFYVTGDGGGLSGHWAVKERGLIFDKTVLKVYIYTHREEKAYAICESRCKLLNKAWSGN